MGEKDVLQQYKLWYPLMMDPFGDAPYLEVVVVSELLEQVLRAIGTCAKGQLAHMELVLAGDAQEVPLHLPHSSTCSRHDQLRFLTSPSKEGNLGMQEHCRFRVVTKGVPGYTAAPQAIRHPCFLVLNTVKTIQHIPRS